MLEHDAVLHRCAIAIRSDRAFGGLERRFARLFAHLVEAGHDVTLFCTADALSRLRELDIPVDPARVRVVDRCPGSSWLSRKWNRLRGIVVLLNQLRRGRFAHVHIAANPGPFTFLYSLGARLLPPYSFSVVDSSTPPLYERSKFSQFLIRRSVNRASGVDCLSPRLREAVLRVSGSIATRVVRVSPCSFTDLSRVGTAQERDIDFLFLGRFTAGKGLELVARAVEILRAAGGREYKIHVCGHGEMPVTIPGVQVYQVVDSFPILARAKVFLCVQVTNNYPSQSLLEAMASECAVIATDVGETRLLLDPSCAELIPYDPLSLAEAMKRLADDASRRAQLGTAARARVIESHTIERFAEYFSREMCGQAERWLRPHRVKADD